jgi:hypothetical protein
MTRVEELLGQSAQLANLSIIQRRLGNETAATEALDRALATALAYLATFNGEWLLDARSRQVARIFNEFVWAQARAGATQRALAAIEALRAGTVRLHTMSEEERIDGALTMMRQITPGIAVRVVNGESRAYLDRAPPPPPDTLSLEPIDAELAPLLTRLEKIPTALVSVVAAEARGLTALICWADGTIDSEQWNLTSEGSLPAPGYDAPGLFRERRLQAISRSSYEDLFGPVDRMLRVRGVKRIVLSVPGWLGRFPLEALFDGEAFVGDRYEILYVPSLRLGADLARRKQRNRAPRVLLVGYDDDDLQMSKVEQEGLCTLLRGRVRALSPAECSKATVLTELQGNYDAIHFCCHASYDDSNPIGAALHLVRDPRNDRQRITAYELLSRVTFQHAPVVTLSACSSGVMDLSDTSSAYGLVGGLLRAGARCVIGTRWPVYDDTAAKTMVAMYERQSLKGGTSVDCLHAVTSEMRSTSGIEDWAAFGCIGIP